MATERNTTRRAVLAGATALAAGTAVNTLAIATTKAAEPDPILAAIERHDKAWTDYGPVLGERSRLEELLPEELSRSRIAVPAEDVEIYPTDDPRWIAVERAVEACHAAERAACADLLKIAPTTVNGVAALLSYVGNHACRNGTSFGWGNIIDAPIPEDSCGWVKEHGVSTDTAFHLHLANVLTAIARVE